MTQLKFNLDMDELTEQILNSNLNAATKGLAVAIFNAYMEAERDAHVQAKTRERSEERQDMRNCELEAQLAVGKPLTINFHLTSYTFFFFSYVPSANLRYNKFI